MEDIRRYKIVCKDNKEWREERSKSIGASAVGVLFGESSFRTPLELAIDMKRELRGVFCYDQTLAMMRGHAYEQGVADLFSWSTGKVLIGRSSAEYLVRRSDIPFMHASPDRTYWIDENGSKSGKNSEANKGLVECKTTMRPIDPENLPVSWRLQLQVQMGICGYTEGYIAWDVISRHDGFGFQRFEFDEEQFNKAVSVCRYFWDNCIMGDEQPECIKPSDVLIKHPTPEKGKTLTATHELEGLIADLKELKEHKKQLDGAVKKIEDAIKMQMKEGEESIVDVDGNYLVTWKASAPSVSFDDKKLYEEHPDIWGQYAYEKPGTRRFNVK